MKKLVYSQCLFKNFAINFLVGLLILFSNQQISAKQINDERFAATSLKNHIRIWEEIVSSKQLKDQLALNASRTLAVKYPHIYLKADLEFIKEVQTIKGITIAYQADIRADMNIYLNLPTKDGKGFHFDLVNFEHF